MTEHVQHEPVCATCERPFRFDDAAVTVDAHLVHALCLAQVRGRRASSSLNPGADPMPDRSSAAV